MLARGKAPDAPQIQIVGVVANGRHDGPKQPYKPEIFVPIAQRPARGVAVVIEPSRDIASASSSRGTPSRRDCAPLLGTPKNTNASR